MAKGQRWYPFCILAALGWVSPSYANGRFPRAERLVENRNDPNQIYLAATYGLLATSDRGRTWHHICEASFSLQDTYLGDPILDLTGNQSLLVGVQARLNVSRDGGCQWTQVLGGGTTYVLDYAIARSEPSTVVALLGDYSATPIAYSLRKSIDDGATWAPFGVPLPTDLAYTIDVDPRDPTHLYASGLVNDAGQLFTSLDDGASWTAHAIPNTRAIRAPYIAGLHPLDANRIFVRTDAWIPIDGGVGADDALLYSSDGGDTWTELFKSQAKLFGFALSPDGSRVLIGYGDPQAGAGRTVSGPFGVFASSTDHFAFEPVLTARVGCLAWTPTGVYVCGLQAFDGFEVGFSPTADFAYDGGCTAPLLALDQVKGPLACGEGTTGAVCKSAWDVACLTFGACGDAAPAEASCPMAQPRDGAATDDGAADSNARDSSGPDVEGSTTAAVGPSGCGCRTIPRPARREATLDALSCVAFLALLRAATSRRRQRSQ